MCYNHQSITIRSHGNLIEQKPDGLWHDLLPEHVEAAARSIASPGRSETEHCMPPAEIGLRQLSLKHGHCPGQPPVGPPTSCGCPRRLPAPRWQGMQDGQRCRTHAMGHWNNRNKCLLFKIYIYPK